MAHRKSELEEAAEHYNSWLRDLWRKRASRRMVIKGSTLLALGGAAALPELLAACTKAPEQGPATPASTSVPGAPTKVAEQWQDTTITPPYKMGNPNAVVDDRWKEFPYVYKYSFRRHNWSAPVTTGGHIIRGAGPPPNYDMLKGGYGNVMASMYMNGLVHHTIHEGMNLDSTALELDLAESMEHNSDYTEWTFKLIKGVKFQNIDPVNGREMTADDVVYSFERYIDTSVWGNPLRFVDKITAPDNYTVKFTMKQPALTFDATVALPYYQAFAKEHFEKEDLFLNQPIGTGAYQLTYSKYQDKAEAVRHPEYFGKPFWMKDKYKNVRLPFADAVTHQYYATDADARAAFIAGKTDEYNITFLDPPILKEVLSAAPNTQVVVNATWAATPTWVCWNYANKLFADVRVRRALSMAIDRKAIVKNVLGGAGVPGASCVPFDLQGRDTPPPLEDYGPYYQFNPTEAKKLLTEAGYPNGFKTQLEIAAPPQGVFYNIYVAMQDMWRKNLGVDMEIVAKDSLIVQNDRLKRTYSDMIVPFSIIGYDADSLASPLVYPGSANNWGDADDPELKALMDKMRTATTPESLLDSTKKFLNRLYDQVTYLWVCWSQGCTLSQPWVHGLTNTTYAFVSYFAMNNWRNIWIDSTAPGGRGGKEV